jgi:uncharacterized protein (TIGR02246 family)
MGRGLTISQRGAAEHRQEKIMTDSWTRDQLEIRSLIENYSDAVMRRDSATIMTLWSDDCVWGVPDMPGYERVAGKAAIRQSFESAQALFPFCFLICVPGHIAIEGDRATARTYTTEILTDTGGATRRAVGRYEDEFARSDGRWLFTERIWYILHSD